MPEADADVDRDARAERIPGLVLTGAGGLGVIVGIVLVVVDNAVGLIVLMVGLAACVLGLDMWILRAPQLHDAEPEEPEEAEEPEEPEEAGEPEEPEEAEEPEDQPPSKPKSDAT
ncbi:MAG: hypothetical protein IT198_10740 [Acidimicrobiia bacterium]|nr:hypothetical protein [Acidimicrobiia bacterium]